MDLFVVGINHKSAPLAIREKFAIAESRLDEFLSRSVTLPHVEEILALSTCNRVELYGASRHGGQAIAQVSRLFAEFQGVDPKVLEQHAYGFQKENAVRHGFRMTSSLDSMMVGEPQILGQVKEAYRQACEVGTTGKLLHKFFHHAFHVAKKVRQETGISSQPVSVSYAAAVLARQIFGDLSGKRALVLGAGKMSELAVLHLKKSGIQTLYIANRTPERAEEIAHKVGGEAIPFEKFEKWLADADIVITSTASPDYLIRPPMVQEAIRQRKNRPMFFIDIAVPRNVSPEVNHLSDVYLYDIDELGAVVEANKSERNREAELAVMLIDREVEAFSKTLKTLKLAPTLSSLSKKFEKISRHELEKAFQRLPHLDADACEAIETLAHSIVNKILHDPMVALKEDQPQENSPDYGDLVRKLFRLDEM